NRSRQSFLRAIREIARSLLRIVEGDETEALQTFGRMAAELGQPVVVNLKTGALKAGVFDPKHAKSQRRVQHIALDAVLIHILQPLPRIPAAAVRARVRKTLEQLVELIE